MKFLSTKLRGMLGPKSTYNRIVASWHWLKSDKYRLITGVIILLLFLSAISLLAYESQQKDNVGSSSAPTQFPDKNALLVESSVPNIEMKSAENCINNTSSLRTPFDCKDSATINTSITVIAPAEATIDGKKFVFESWDGCSVGNDDKKICTVHINKNDSKKIKANYSATGLNTSNSTPSSANNIPVKPPTINCQSNTPDVSGYVTCSVVVYSAPLGYSFAPVTAPECGSVLYDAGDGSAPIVVECPEGQQVYYWGTLSQPLHISCVIATACADYTPRPDHVSNLTDTVLVPTTLNVRVPYKAKFSYGTRSIHKPYTPKSIPAHGLSMDATFVKWIVDYDPNRLGTNKLDIMASYTNAN